eukprot:ANDGO_05849.mRNA.1 Acetoacetyl-coenzyme A synthetase
MSSAEQNPILWTPSDPLATQLAAFYKRAAASVATSLPAVCEPYVAEKGDKYVAPIDYNALWKWSIEQPAEFWSLMWDFCGLVPNLPSQCKVVENGVKNSAFEKTAVLSSDDMRSIPSWFPSCKVNYAENALRFAKSQPDHPAMISYFESSTFDSAYDSVTYAQLEMQVARLANALRKTAHIKPGDAIGAYAPNAIPTAAMALASAAVGSVYSTTAPDFAPRAVLDRLGQVKPRVLLASDMQVYRGKAHDLESRIADIVEGIETVEMVIVFPFGHHGSAVEATGHERIALLKERLHASRPQIKVLTYDEFLHSQPFDSNSSVDVVQYEQVSFAHPLYILYTSGTTGAPKCLVHSHGGTLLKHACEHILHVDMKPQDIMQYYTTTAWMMWHWQLSGLLAGSTLVLYDGSPFHPGHAHQGACTLFDLADIAKVTVFGTSAKYIATVLDHGYQPAKHHSLSTVRSVLSTGSPLIPDAFDFVYRDWSPNVHLASISGGTDILGCFMGGCAVWPVRRGEIQARLLGMAIEARDTISGAPVMDAQGELVCAKPFPSMPVSVGLDFSDKTKYHSAYFHTFAGDVWCHGDWVSISAKSFGLVMYGRSDATLNPGGVRFGSAELYNVVERMPEIADSVVIAQRLPRGDDERVVMFVKMAPGFEFTSEVKDRIRGAIRTSLSPRHVPAVIVQVTDIPYTVNGKKVEVAVKRVVQGEAFTVSSAQQGALANPQALELFRNIPEVMHF